MSQSASRYPLAKDGVFWTIQGEGLMRGVPMVFIRLAGCSVGCLACDTDYRVAERVTVDEILQRVDTVTPPYSERYAALPQWVWITGGEPTDHDLRPLIAALHGQRKAVALATSGVREVGGLGVSFLSVSPHTTTFTQTTGTELKVVPGLNGMTLAALDGKDLRFEAKFVQPLWGDGPTTRKSLRLCVDWVLEHPDWALTDQGHKEWGLP